MRKLIIIPALCFSIVALGACDREPDTTPVDTTQSPARTEPVPTATPPATTTTPPPATTTAQQPTTTPLPPSQSQPAIADGQTHTAKGTITQIDASKNQVTVEHEAVASLDWPAMTMTFEVRDATQLQALEQGDSISFDFEQAGENRYVISRIEESDASQLSQQEE